MNDRKKVKRSDLGIEMVRALAGEGRRIFSIDDARVVANRIGIRPAYLPESLYHLRRTDWIVSLRRGLYALSPSIPGIAPPHEFEIAMALVTPAAISHWSALHHHGLTDQVPRKTFVLTTTQTAVPRTSGFSGWKHGGTTYQFVQTKPEHFFGTEKIWVGEARVLITDPERTLLDGLAMPDYCGDFAEVLHAFEVRGSQLQLDRITEYATRLTPAIAKRLGWVLEKQGVSIASLEPFLKMPIAGYRKLNAAGPRKGPYNARWRIQENLPGKINL